VDGYVDSASDAAAETSDATIDSANAKTKSVLGGFMGK
jgi:hypothetical protein